MSTHSSKSRRFDFIRDVAAAVIVAFFSFVLVAVLDYQLAVIKALKVKEWRFIDEHTDVNYLNYILENIKIFASGFPLYIFPAIVIRLVWYPEPEQGVRGAWIEALRRSLPYFVPLAILANYPFFRTGALWGMPILLLSWRATVTYLRVRGKRRHKRNLAGEDPDERIRRRMGRLKIPYEPSIAVLRILAISLVAFAFLVMAQSAPIESYSEWRAACGIVSVLALASGLWRGYRQFFPRKLKESSGKRNTLAYILTAFLAWPLGWLAWRAPERGPVRLAANLDLAVYFARRYSVLGRAVNDYEWRRRIVQASRKNSLQAEFDAPKRPPNEGVGPESGKNDPARPLGFPELKSNFMHLALVVVDTLRAEEIHRWLEGADRPALARFHNESLHFGSAYSASTSTLGGFSGLYVGAPLHEIRGWSTIPPWNGGILLEETTWPERLQSIFTTEYVGSRIQSFAAPELGFRQGFSKYKFPPTSLKDSAVIDVAIADWRYRPTAPRKLQVVYLTGPHEYFGYKKKQKKINSTFETKVANARYEALSNSTADQIEELLKTYYAAGRNFDTALILTADHGEALGERGFYGHVFPLDETVTKVPLLVKLPQVGGAESPALVSTTQLMQWIASLSLSGGEHPVLAGDYPVVSEQWNYQCGRSALVGVGNDKIVFDFAVGLVTYHDLKQEGADYAPLSWQNPSAPAADAKVWRAANDYLRRLSQNFRYNVEL